MVSNLFTAFALIACGGVEVPPAPAQPLPVPEIRGALRELDPWQPLVIVQGAGRRSAIAVGALREREADDADPDADKGPKRR